VGASAAAVILLIAAAGNAPAQETPMPRQILVEANIWEINEAASIDYGIIWDLVDLDAEINDILDSSIFLPGFLSGTGGTSGNPTGAFVQTTLDILRRQTRDGVTDDYMVAQLNTIVQAAAREGTAHLRANPKIVVLENKEAVIHAGDKFPITELTVSKQGLPVLNTVYKDTGVKLTVLAKIYRDEFVILNVFPEVADITSFVELDAPPPVAGADPELFRLPVLADRSAWSKMIVRTGGTVIMSGLLSELRTEVRREVPIVSKIPLLGWLFRSYNWALSKTDILIEITPTILEPGESRYTPNGLIYEGEIFNSDSDVVREVQEARPPAPTEPPVRGPAEEWFGVTPDDKKEEPGDVPIQETPIEQPAPTEPAPADSAPADSAPAEVPAAT